MKRNNKQQGFTIIELVVVILLLGILTATALPRFMDVTDEAHDAVVDGVSSGLQTGAALARASWMATGQPAALVDYNNLNVSSVGYVIGASVTTTIKDHTDCVEIFDGLLQAGRPLVQISTVAGLGAIAAADLSTAVASTDFVAKAGTAGSHSCQYAYIGQFRTAAAGGVPVLTYNASTGVVGKASEL